MRAGSFKLRIERLRQLLSECPPVDDSISQQIKSILQTAPQVLQQIETAIQNDDPLSNQTIHENLAEIETLIEWAVKSVKGQAIVESVKTGKHTDPSLPADQRLMNRLMMFMLTKIDRNYFLQLVSEFSGEDAVDGDKVFMNPGEETESFSQWLTHDVILPGQTERLIDLFVKEEADKLPQDEKSLLKCKQADRLSIFKVTELPKNKWTTDITGIYSITDMLSPKDVFRIWDVSSSKTIREGSMFIGRVFPVDDKTSLFNLMGIINEISDQLWQAILKFIMEWSGEYFLTHPNSTQTDFFRAHHSRLRRTITNLTGGYSKVHENQWKESTEKISTSEKKIQTAQEIHQFVMKDGKKTTEQILSSPQLLEYMNKFKWLMDTCAKQDLDHLCSRYEGLYEFARLLEDLAGAIQDGSIKVP